MKPPTTLCGPAILALFAIYAAGQIQPLPETATNSFEIHSNSVFGQIPSLALDSGVRLEDSTPVLMEKRLSWDGILSDLFEADQPLQLINPFAPPEYGAGEENLVRDPVSNQPSGLRLLSFKF